MADRYCDPGRYGVSASFTGTSSSSTLTVSAIASGQITLGMLLTGGSFVPGTIVTAFGTGTGGTGTYTISPSQAVASSTSLTGILGLPAATPTWGTAQDGDGLGTGTPTPATASIDLGAYTADAGDTFVVGGATLTCVASGATTNQFNAGSGQTLADNLVAAINRTTNTSIAAAAATNWGTPKIQDCFYARRTGTAVLEIMTRAGSATYNANSSFKVVSTGLTGGSQIDQTFSGGASGPWGWLWSPNNVTMWPSGIAALGYGVMVATNCIAGPSVSYPTDTVHIRGNNNIYYFGLTGNTTVNLSRGAIYLVDDGTIWTGDSGSFTLRFRGVANNSSFAMWGTSKMIWSARQREGLVFDNSSAYTFSWQFGVAGPSQPIHFDNFLAIDNGYTISFNQQTTNNYFLTLTRGHMKFTRNVWYRMGNASASSSTTLRVHDVIFEWTAYSGAQDYLFNPPLGGGCDIEISDCKAIGATPRIFGTSNTTQVRAVARNMEGFDLGSTLAGIVGNWAALRGEIGYYLLQNIGAHRSMRLETGTCMVDWVYGQGYPTLDAYLPDGTPWSYRVMLSNDGQALDPMALTQLIALTKTYIAADAIKTITAEVLLDPAVDGSIAYNMLGLVVTYTGSDGNVYHERNDSTVWFADNTTAIPTSAASWTKNSYTTFVARKSALTTAHAIKQNTEIEVSIVAAQPAPALSYFFLNPEIGIS